MTRCARPDPASREQALRDALASPGACHHGKGEL